MRLDKFVCKSTELTKTQATALIVAGDVMVNGVHITEPASQVHENNKIELYGQRLKPRDFRYIMLHKSAGVICSNTDEGYPSVFKGLVIDNVTELHLAGRLDVDTTGMVLITDDGRWSYNITLPTTLCPKVYRVDLLYSISDEAACELIDKFAQGIQLQGEEKITLPARLEIINPQQVLLTITEGRYHQVKRMFAAVGNKVRLLHRESIGGLQLDVPQGKWRYLTQIEVASIA